MTPKKLEYINNKTKSISYLEQNPKQSISLVLKIGDSLRKCALIAKTTAIREGNFENMETLSYFIDIFSAQALRNLNDKHLDKEIVILLTDDLIKLNKYIDSQITEYSELLSKLEQISMNNWKKLASAMLAKIIIFNKRRRGEDFRMELDSFKKQTGYATATKKY